VEKRTDQASHQQHQRNQAAKRVETYRILSGQQLDNRVQLSGIERQKQTLTGTGQGGEKND